MEPQRSTAATPADRVELGPVQPDDLPHVIALDERVTGTAKPDYWQDIYERFATRRPNERFFLVARDPAPDARHRLLGYIVGEIRSWEFGSPPCGWIFAFSVEPDTREQRIGERLFQAISDAFRKAGVGKMRTMVSRQNMLHMAFFRSEGMVAGPYLQLEKDLDD